ncbi:MAG: zinc ribbon domain-containing protein [Candidatus Rokubacteria bacterium]|nr:zinc ribbon domain-containing protein [Candidatus Rokubacteria bacterium]
MPLYEFYCDKCKKEVSMTLSIREREKGEAACPKCGNREMRPLVGTFYSKTSKKS